MDGLLEGEFLRKLCYSQTDTRKRKTIVTLVNFFSPKSGEHIKKRLGKIVKVIVNVVASQNNKFT